jgi:hypothetical protein
MPVATHNLALFSERYPSSFPQNIAYEAAKRLNPQKAKRFLRLLREATFIEGKRTSQIDIIIKEATRAGFCAAKFIDEYTTGSAQADFMQDRMKCKRNGVTGFPSYIIRNDDTKIFLRGYQNFSTMQALISRLSADKVKPRRIGPSKTNVIDFIKHYGRVFPVEIEVAFNLDKDKTDLIINELAHNRKIKYEEIGNGHIISPISTEWTQKKEDISSEENQNNKKQRKIEA